MEIGHPTDVKHVAHIGWEGPSGSAPTWMNEFRGGADFAATSIGNSGSALSPWSSQDMALSRVAFRLQNDKHVLCNDFGESTRQQSESEMFKDMGSTELPSIKKKEKRKKSKSKSTSSPKSISSYSSRSSRTGKSKSKFIEANANPANIQVA
ncbi:hypothetical protein DH2020_032895 [Rehmannia glutinosa]|uniref:CRIB domain-containing protein n=1 Tax=Rehmannia glutinosa TaxID=99300 RepID=A0ABR0VGS4_REHGL